MSAKVRFEGLAELKAGLHQIPIDLSVEAQRLVRTEAILAQLEIARQYRFRTGRLKRSVQIVTTPTPPGGASMGVEVGAPYWMYHEAWLKVRVFAQTMRRHRAELYRKGADVLRRAGFEVRA